MSHRRLVLKCCGILSVTLVGLVLTTESRARQSLAAADDAATKTAFMRRKLATAHKVIEGLSTDDFKMIEEGANEWLAIAETATWKIPRDPFYMQYSQNFETAVASLIDAAKDKSIDKATFAYAHVTFSCTACHQHVRGVRRVSQQPAAAYGGTAIRSAP